MMQRRGRGCPWSILSHASRGYRLKVVELSSLAPSISLAHLLFSQDPAWRDRHEERRGHRELRRGDPEQQQQQQREHHLASLGGVRRRDSPPAGNSPAAKRVAGGANGAILQGTGGSAQVAVALQDAFPQVYSKLPPLLWKAVQVREADFFFSNECN